MVTKIERDTVINMLRTLPDDGLISLGFGTNTTFSRDELIEHIKKDDEVGAKIVEIYMNYLRSLKELSR